MKNALIALLLFLSPGYIFAQSDKLRNTGYGMLYTTELTLLPGESSVPLFTNALGLFRYAEKTFYFEPQFKAGFIRYLGENLLSAELQGSLVFRSHYFTLKSGLFAGYFIFLRSGSPLIWPGLQVAIGSGRKFISKRLNADLYMRIPVSGYGVGLKLGYTFGSKP